jgi:predicted phage tail protein
MTTPVKSNQQHIFIHDAICEGPVEGLLYGESSIYLNNNRARPLNPDAPYAPLNGKIEFTSTSDTTGSLSSNIPGKYVGTPNNTNYLVIRGGSIEKSGTPVNNSGVFTITGNASFTDAYTTEGNLNKVIALVSTDESNQVYLLGEGKLNETKLTFTPLNPQYDTAIIVQNQDYKVQLLETLEISSIAVDSITVTSGPSLGANGSSPYTYYISGSIQPDAENPDADAPSVQKVKVQFRNGSTIQDPIVELNGVGGGSSYTGNPQDAIPQQLKQLNVAAWNNSQSGTPANKVPKSDTPAGDPFPNYKSGNYPEGESIASEGAISPTIITATDFGVSSGQIPLLDEVRVSISYNALYAVSKKDGKETTNTAVYLFQIRKKAPGASTFNEWQNAFNDGGNTNVGEIKHTAKNKSAISFEHFIDLTFIKPFEDFEIRITRLTRHKGRACLSEGQDSGVDQELEGGDSTSFISNITAINRDKFSYPHTAHAGIFLDSREYSSVPQRSYEMRGMRVHVPNGYIPRDYSSTGDATYPDFWDGTMSESRFYTNNPAWVFYDIIVNDRFGAGEWIKEGDVDLYALYRISKYCDELVDDGKGGTEPRFTANLYLSKATDVYKVLKDMATIFTSLIYWMDGKMTTILDGPGDPVYNFSRANVIDGVFSYETTGQKTKTNQVVVTWNDPELNYEQSTLVIEDRASIVREGRIIKEDAFAFGCTSEGQAQRYGKWKLFTAQGQTEIISFKTALEGAFIRPGDIIQVQDTARYGAKFSGRIANVTATGDTQPVTNIPEYDIELDRPVTLGSSTYELAVIITEPAAFYVGEGTVNIRNADDDDDEETYTRGERITRAWVDDNNNGTRTLQTVDTEAKASNAWTKKTGGEFLPTTWKEDSYVESKSISNNQSDVSTLTTYFNTAPKANSIWVITETESGTPTVGSADLYKVLSIAQDNKNIYSISAVEHTNDKYAYVDNPDSILDLPNDVFPTEPEFAVAPTQIRVLQTSDASRPDEELQIEWDYPALVDVGAGELQETTRYLDGFEIVHNVPGIESPVNAGKRARNYTFTNVPDGSYFFRVQAISISGKRSDWITARYLVDDPFSDNVNRIKGLQTEGLTTHFPYITNQTGILGAIRGAYDTTGSVTYSTNDVVTDGGQSYYLSGSDTNVGHVSVSADNTATPGTWTEYSAGILKFNDSGENVVLAPSKFRSDETVSLTSGYTLDCSAINSLGTNFPGIPGGNPRVAYVVLDHGSSALKLIKADFDEALNLFYWQDLSAYDPTDTNAVWSALTGTATVAAGSNKVVGTGTTFTSLNNLNKLKFSTTGSSITPSGITWSSVASSGIATVSATGHGLAVGDIITISGANPEGYNEYTVTISSVASDGNSFTYSIGTDPGTYVSGASITPYTFYEAARVAYIESDTVLYLNRKLDQDTAFSGDVRVQEYAPDFRKDVIIGQVLYNTTNGNYRFKNFLTLDPNLTAARSVFLDSNVAYAQFDLSNNPILLPDNIIVDATATGFENPEFKITYGGTGDANFTAEDTDFSTASPNPFKYEKTIYTNTGSNDLSYGTGAAYEITVTVREANDPGNTDKQRTDTFDIFKVDNVAAGSGAKIVTLELEDYSIVYDADGENPSFNSVLSAGDITATATASPGFANPIFRFTIDGTQGSWVSSATNVSTATYTVPSTIETWGSGTGGTRVFTVEVAEEPDNFPTAQPAAGDIEASDSASLLAVQIGQGGLAIVLSNPTHSLTANDTGVVSSNTGSGTTIEVFVGGVGIDYTTSLTPSLGQWTISSISDSGGTNITPGTPTTSGTNPVVASVPDHTFSSVNALDDQEAITYTITIPQGAGKADLTATAIQTFSLAKGAAAANSSVIVFLYTAKDSAPSGPTNAFPPTEVDLTTGLVISDATGTNFQDGETDANGDSWYRKPNDTGATSTENIWVIAAAASSTTSTAEVAWDDWTVPVQFTGTDGFNQATVELFIANDDDTTAPNYPGDLTYTFDTGALSGSLTPVGGTGSWDRDRMATSRANPYVWRIAAAAISQTNTTAIDGVDTPTNVDGEDWGTAIIVDRFIEDGITLELNNDVESVGGTGLLENLSIATTAFVYRAGTDITSEWDFKADVPSNLTCNGVAGPTSAGQEPSGTGTNGNTFTVTQLETGFTSGNVVITASPKAGGDYVGAASRSVSFTVTRLPDAENGVSYRIVPSVAAIGYDPNTTPPAYSGGGGGSNNEVTFTAYEIKNGTSTAKSGYWVFSGAGTDNISNPSNSFTATATGTTGSNLTASFYLNSGPSDIVDTETVPIIPSGTDGADSTVPGDRGAGRWNINVDNVNYTSGTAGRLPLTSEDAGFAWDNGTFVGTRPGDEVAGDQAWFFKGTAANPTSQSVWIYNGTDWVEQDEVIDGNLLVAGTITADRLDIGTIGLTDSRMLLLEDSLKIFEGTTLRVHLGNLSNTTT